VNFKLVSLWRDRGLALLAGLAAALAHPPFGVLPGLLGYALLLWLLDTIEGPRPLRSAFLRGWLAGLGYFGLGTGWIGEAFMVDAANQGWMAPFAVSAMAGGLALFWGVAAVIYRLIRPAGVRRVLVFAGADGIQPLMYSAASAAAAAAIALRPARPSRQTAGAAAMARVIQVRP